MPGMISCQAERIWRDDRGDHRAGGESAGGDRPDYRGGIKALWNFTPFRIRVPEHIVVQNTSMYAHLAVMFNRLNSMNH